MPGGMARICNDATAAKTRFYVANSVEHCARPPPAPVINRLKRADGHLKNVIAMLIDGRSCLDVVQQLQAVENAIHAA